MTGIPVRIQDNLSDLADDAGSVLLERLVLFARTLRDNGFAVGPAETQNAIQIITDEPGYLGERQLRRLLQLLFCKRKSELELYQTLFDAFWLGRATKKSTLRTNACSDFAKQIVEKNGEARSDDGAMQVLSHYFQWLAHQKNGKKDEDTGATHENKLAGASVEGAKFERDISQIRDLDEAEAILEVAERIGQRLKHRLSRRSKSASKGSEIDLRTLTRASVRTNGLLLELPRRQRKTPPFHLLIMVDVSSSMASYSLFLIQFMLGLANHSRQCTSFVFNNYLIPLPARMKQGNAPAFMQLMRHLGQDLSGGTNIGAAISKVNQSHKEALQGKRTICLLMTDGLDAGERSRLDTELQNLKRKCRRLFWLNPLGGRADFKPTATGPALLNQHADRVFPCNNLRSLHTIERALIHEL